MDLASITIRGLVASKTAECVRALEELPQEVIRGTTTINADYGSYNNKSGALVEVISLTVVTHDKKEADKISFHTPNGASNISRERYCLEFDYKERHYQLKVDVDWNPC